MILACHNLNKSFGESRTVDVHVGNIRKKLDFADVIITVPRVGYRMEVSNEYD